MIDTICLLIPVHDCVFLDKDGGERHDWNLQSRTDQYEKYVRNPTKADKATGLYFPRLTFTRRQQGANVKIEFSAPKLLHGNNLDELVDTDFDRMLDALRDRLERMGVRIFRHLLEHANVSTVHYSKNILLTGGHTATHLINELNKIDLRKSFDFGRARFINNGESLFAHTNAHELVIYDKVADLHKGAKRAIDRDQSPKQKSLFDDFTRKKEPTEILRFEIRLCTRQKIKSLLKILNLANDLTFRQLFSTDVSQKVVTYYWRTIINAERDGLFTIAQSPKDTLRDILKAKPSIKPKQAIALVGMLTLARDGNGLGELRSIICKNGKDRTWHRLLAEYRRYTAIISPDLTRDWVRHIDLALKHYEPYKIIL